MRLISQGPGEYLSEDGRVHVILDHTFETECSVEHGHPVRMRLDDFKRPYSSEKYAKEAVDKMMASGAKLSTKKTKQGWVQYISWYCEGGELHNYSQWTSQVDDEWTEFVTDTFGETVGSLEKLLGEEIKVVHPRKPKQGVGVFSTTKDEYHLILEDELRGIEQALVRYDELMQSDDAEFVDQNLHEWHLKRKEELQGLIAL